MLAILSFLTRRLAQGILIVLIASLIVFTLLRVGPGDPARMLAGGLSDEAAVEALSKSMGLSDPVIVQFGHYLGDIVFDGSLGRSYVRSATGQAVAGGHGNDATRNDRAEVLDLILERLPLSLQLAGLGLGLALAISIPVGIFAGVNANKWPESVTLMVSSLMVSMPSFWLAGLLVLVVSIQWQLLPPVGYQGFSYVILPAVVLAIELAPIFIRSISMAVAAMRRKDFVRIAPVRGIGARQVFTRHVLRGAAVPLINTLGIMLTGLISSILVIEYVFDFPGLGALTVEAVMQRDFPLIQAIAVIVSAFFVIVNITVDLTASLFDPRLNY